MKILKNFLVFVMCLSMLVIPLCNDSYCIENNDIKPIYFVLDENSNSFVEKSSMSNAPNISIPNTYQYFTVNGKNNRLKILSVSLDEEATNNTPYTGMERMKSLANGQTSTITEQYSHQKVTGVSKVVTSNKGFSFGLKLVADESPVTKVIQKVIKSFTSFSFSSKYTFDKTYKTESSETKVVKYDKSYSKDYYIPNLEEFTDCNSADFYSFTNYYVYDVVAKIEYDEDVTDEINKGYIAAYNTFVNKAPYEQFGKCVHCGKKVMGCDMCIPCYEEMPEEDENKIVHVELANGLSGHCGRNLWKKMKADGYYKPYVKDKDTIVNYKFYWPVIEGVVVPWKINGPNDLVLNKPIHMVPSGMEEIVYNDGKCYKLVINKSELVDPYYNILMPGEQIGAPIMPGLDQTITFSDSIQVKTATKKTKIKKKTHSSSLIAKFKNWISISAGHNKSKTTVDSSSTEITETKSLEESNHYTMPQYYINAGYDGARIHLTKDTMKYEVEGEIIPIKEDGTLDLENTGILSYTQEKDYPRVYTAPYKVTP